MRRYLRHLFHQAAFLAPIVALVLSMVPVFGPPPVAEAAVATGPAFGSAVACLNGAPSFAVTRTEDTVFANPNPAAYAGVQTLTFGGAAVSQATLAQIGAVYSLAYDDGAASGQERLFVAAYTRRFVHYGPAGAGGIYVLNRSGNSWVLAGSVQVPGAAGVAHSVGATPPHDAAATAGVGRTALGGMVVSPDGRQLYVVNVAANSIARFNLGAGLPTYVSSFPIDLNQISTAANVRADLTAFALQWWVHPSQGTEPLLLVGVTDTARRGVAWGNGGEELEPRLNANGTFQIPPRAYVLLYNTVTGAWAKSVDIDLGNTASLANRLEGSAFLSELPRPANYGGISYEVKGWNPWRNNLSRIARLGQEMRYPQPLLTNIEFVRETAPTASNPEPLPMMLLGIRDRTGDIAFNNAANIPAGEFTAVSQGDVLALRLAGGTWNIVASDYFNDNWLPRDAAGSTKHLENFTGGISRIPGAGTRVGGAGDTLALMGLAGLRHSGLYSKLDNAAAGGVSDGYTDLINSSHRAATKATNLGDVEVLCSYALVGGRVWNDADGGGVQGAGESGIAGIRLEVVRPGQSTVLASATTDSQGRYLFAVPPNTSLHIRINVTASGGAISGYHLTRQNAGGSDTADSDAAVIGGVIPFVRAGDSTTISGAITAPWRESDRRSYDIGLTRSLPTGRVGDRVWLDADGDGVQDSGELDYNLSGTITLRALSSEPGVVNRTTTASGGRYIFADVVPGTYQLVFPAPPSGFRVSPQDRGGSDATDSDPNTSTYTTAQFVVGDAWQTNWDYGLIGGADVWIAKSASAATVPVGGQYTYTLNYGNRTGQATNLVINDTLPAGVTFVSSSPAPTTRSGQALSWNVGTLNAGVSGSIQITVRAPTTLAPSTAVQQVVQNCATITTVVTDLAPADNSSCVNTTVQRPEVSILKTGAATAVVDSTYTYNLTYANSGTAAATNLIVNDTLPANLIFVSSSPAPTTRSGQALSWNVGTLNPGVSGSIQITVRAPTTFTPANAVQQVVQNCATITAPVGDNPANNSSCANTTLQRPEVGITKAAPATALVGDEFNYTLNYGNSGTAPAANVAIRDTLPTGIQFVRWVSNPGNACSIASGVVDCNLGTLAAGASGQVVFAVRANLATMPGTGTTQVSRNTAVIGRGPDPTSSTPWVGDDPGNNTSSTDTSIQFPDPSVGIFINPAPTSSNPEMLPVGEWGSIDVTYGNSGAGIARTSVLTVTYDIGGRLGTMPAGCTNDTANQRVVCQVGDIPAGATRTLRLPLRLPATPADAATFAEDIYRASVEISTATPERATHRAANNTASDTVNVIRPDVFVTAEGPEEAAPPRIGWGTYFYYDIGYGNLYAKSQHLTRAAENTVLVVTLPDDVTLQGSSVPPTTENGQILTWNLGTLAPRQTGSIRLTVQTNVPAGTLLHLEADISTTTPGDDLSNNHAEVDTLVQPPPTSVPDAEGQLRLMIHSTLDPNHGGNPRDGVYLTEPGSSRIAWPAGEVLDFTPRLESLDLEPLPFPYEYRARVTGWSVVGFEVNGREFSATAADSRNRAGCRGEGSLPGSGSLLTGCVYSYVGAYADGRLPDEALPAVDAVTETDMADQAHAYWTQPPAATMRNDVYLYTLSPLRPVQLTVQVEVEVWVVNAYPGLELEPPDWTYDPIEMPGLRRRHVITQPFDVTLLVPRSVVGPGGVNP